MLYSRKELLDLKTKSLKRLQEGKPHIMKFTEHLQTLTRQDIQYYGETTNKTQILGELKT